MTPPLLLALDPSLACTGGVFVSLDGRRELVEAFTVQTFGDETSYAIEAQHAANLRGLDLCRGIVKECAGRNVACVAYEVPMGAQSADAAWSLARASQSTRIALDVALPHLRPLAVAPTEARLRATGRGQWPKGEGKRRVQNGVRRAWGPMAWDRVLASIVDEKRREAVYDAGAVAMAALRTPAARLVIQDHAAAHAAAQNGGAR